MLAEIHKNGAENGQFLTLIDLKIAENYVFAQKYLIDILPRCFLRNTLF
jgi:hypothetical protein